MKELNRFLSIPVKASSMIGTKVINPKNESLGDIKEIVIDPHTGKVAYAVVSFGGFFHLGEKLFAVPFSAIEYNSGTNEYVLNVSKEKLEAAPGFDPNHWPAMTDEKWNRDIYAYYERSPYWELNVE